MKILNLSINGYKNLKGQAKFDFSKSTNYAALIGLNGSGKSNVLEALSIIFASLYRGSNIKTWNNGNPIDYSITYSLNESVIEVKNGKFTLLKENGVTKNKTIHSGKKDYLPTEVISCYSGDELRMWDEIYSKFYFSYLSKIAKGYRTTKQNLVYINKYSWEFSLLCLLCNPDSHLYLKELLRINELESIKIKFVFPDNYADRKAWFSKNLEVGIASSNEITELIQRIKDEQERTGYLSFTQISSIDLRVRDNIKSCRKLFYLLFAAGMPRENKLFKKIDIELSEGIRTAHLSEGEKKVILVKCLIDILANKNSLVLLDEPDSYMHIAKKKEIKTIVDKDDYFTVLTTHSPTLLNYLDEKNIFIVSNKDDKGLTVYPSEKSKHLEEISGGEFTLMNATLAVSTTKDILLVEGANDYNYLTEALNRFKNEYREFDFLIINCGGAGNVPAILEQSIYPVLGKKQLCVCTFDEDGAGSNGIDGIKKVLAASPKDNVKYITHPRHATFPVEAKEFFMEDYFSVDSYKSIFTAEINKKGRFREYEQIPKVKTIIESNYKKFPDAAYSNFKMILNALTKIQKDFHKPAPVIAKKKAAKKVVSKKIK